MAIEPSRTDLLRAIARAEHIYLRCGPTFRDTAERRMDFIMEDIVKLDGPIKLRIEPPTR